MNRTDHLIAFANSGFAALGDKWSSNRIRQPQSSQALLAGMPDRFIAHNPEGTFASAAGGGCSEQ